MALSFAEIAKEAGHNVVLGAPEDNEYLQRGKKLGLETQVFQAPPALLETQGKLLRGGKISKIWILLSKIVPYCVCSSRQLRRKKIDLVYFAQERGVIQFGLAAKFAGIPALWHIQGNLGAENALFHKLAAALVQNILCVSQSVHRNISTFISPRKLAQVAVIHNGIRNTSSSEAGAKGAVFTVVFAGNIAPHRGAHVLIDAAVQVQGRLKILLAGNLADSDYVQYLEDRIQKHGLERIVDILGFRDDIVDLISQSDVVVFPSIDKAVLVSERNKWDITWQEGFGLSALEGMRAGKPVIASNMDGLREVVVHEQTGLLVRPNDPGALAQAIHTLMEDQNLREDMGNNGRKRFLEFFTHDIMANKLREYLRTIDKGKA